MNMPGKLGIAPGVHVAETPEELFVFRRPECTATVWSRQPLTSFQNWIDALAPEQLPNARVILRHQDVHSAMSRICDLCGTPTCNERALLIDDTAALANIFAKVMRVDFLQMRIDVITSNDCHKFQSDAVSARLICTYRGTGTQFGFPTEGSEPAYTSTVPTGAPILLRGALCPNHPKSALLHRSPPIVGTGEARLVLVLDPVADSEQQPHPKFIH